MDWIAENWFWVLIFCVFILMHLFGHGGHGGHGGHDVHEGSEKRDDYKDKDRQRKNQSYDSGHGRH